jgi:O-antigen ligase
MYGKYIGQITRVSSNTTGESAMSPLILSYCGAVIIGVVAFYLLYVKKINKLTKYLSLVTIALAVIPFFLGASRGSIFAIFIPFFIMAISNLSFKSILKYILLLTIIIILLFYLDEYLGSGLLNRFMGTSEAIERGGSSASRLDIWSKSLSQFLEFPFFGDRLNTVGVDYYPHNIYIEVLQTTGVIGGIPFFVLVYKTIKASFNIFKNHREYAWIPVIFIQSVMRHMFSGALYNASWFWVSMTIVLSLNYYLNKNEK